VEYETILILLLDPLLWIISPVSPSHAWSGSSVGHIRQTNTVQSDRKLEEYVFWQLYEETI